MEKAIVVNLYFEVQPEVVLLEKMGIFSGNVYEGKLQPDAHLEDECSRSVSKNSFCFPHNQLVIDQARRWSRKLEPERIKDHIHASVYYRHL